jgi:hypothetical protein
MEHNMKKISGCLLTLGAAMLLLAGLIQLVPYGRAHDNPPVTRNAPWPDRESEALARRACYDCHSNETVWPWYSNIAPISWLVQRDVDEGREKLNFSTWGQGKQEIDDAIEVLQDGEMPPWNYLPTHPEARLSEREKEALARGLAALGAEVDDD